MDFSKEIQEYLNKALDKLATAKALITLEKYDDAMSRLYYSLFFMMTALLYAENVDISIHKHQYILNQFYNQFIKSGQISGTIFSKIQNIKQYREIADYNIHMHISKENAMNSLRDTEDILNIIQNYLNRKK